MSRYVCAFRGRRDDYQIPFALEEAGVLEQFITDAYASPRLLRTASRLPARWRNAVEFRHKLGLPAARVRSLWGSTLLEHLRHRAGYSRAETYALVDRRYSEVAAARARATRADLLLYSPYAWEAFNARYQHTPRRVLFQFHPLPSFEERLLRGDLATFPEVTHSFVQETGQGLPEALRERIESPWRQADWILCASTFTLRTLLEAGADPAKCSVVPYGIEVSGSGVEAANNDSPPNRFQALFVGSGVQRKGLHHLLRAWEQARLPPESRLKLVCRVLDPGLHERVRRTANVHWLPGVSGAELSALYRTSTLLVMPSLIEGFGQVYLEALAEGCPILGTVNTCLPDLGTEYDGIFLTPVADVDALTARLEHLAETLPPDGALRERARECARTFSWERFRAGVRAVL